MTDDLKNYIHNNPAHGLSQFLPVSKDKKGYVCPSCGHGKNGDGIEPCPNKQGYYYCFGCGRVGDVMELLMCAGRATENNVFDEAEKLYSGCVIESTPKAKKEPVKSETNYSLLAKYVNDIADAQNNINDDDFIKYITSRGISQATAKRFNIGYLPKWRHPKSPSAPESARVVIPTGECNYVARAIDDTIEPKYKKLKAGESKIFNIDILSQTTEPIFICEGEFDALSFEEIGAHSIALGSVSMVNQFLAHFKSHKADIKAKLIITLDTDEAGTKATETLINGLSLMGYQNHVRALPFTGKDPNEFLTSSKEEFIKWVNDCQELKPVKKEVKKHTSLQDIFKKDGTCNYDLLRRPEQAKIDCAHDFMYDDGFIGAFMKHCETYAPYVCYPSIMAGAFATMGFLAGQKFSFNDILPKIYTLGLAPSGGGKNFPLQLVQSIVKKIGYGDSLAQSIASAPGVEDKLLYVGNLLLVIDEIGEYLKGITNDNAKISSDAISLLLRAYTSIQHIRRTLVIKKDDPIFPEFETHNLVVYGCSTYENLFNHVTEEQIIKGLLGRCMAFCQDDFFKVANNTPRHCSPKSSLDNLAELAKSIIEPEEYLHIASSIELTASDEALDYLQMLRTKWDDVYNKSPKDVQKAACTRAYEMICKISMFFALSQQRHEVILADVERAEKCVFQSIMILLRAIAKDVTNGRADKYFKEVQRVLLKYGGINWQTFSRYISRRIFDKTGELEKFCNELSQQGYLQFYVNDILFEKYQRGCFLRWIDDCQNM